MSGLSLKSGSGKVLLLPKSKRKRLRKQSLQTVEKASQSFLRKQKIK